MNERIKEAAFQAGFINKLVSDGSYFLNNPKLEAKLKNFSDLIRADERETLEAKDWAAIMREGGLVTWKDAEELGERVRAAIRARKNT